MKNNNPKPENFEKLQKQLRRLFIQGLNISPSRGRRIDDLRWRGIEAPDFVLVSTVPIQERFCSEYLAHEEERGRDLLDILLTVALHVGMEQGIRVERGTSGDVIDLLRNIQKSLAKREAEAEDSTPT